MSRIRSTVAARMPQWGCLLLLLGGLGVGLAGNCCVAAEARGYEKTVRPFLAKHCLACHGENAKPKRLRLDRLTPQFAGEPGEHWAKVLDQLRTGDMPPRDKPRPDTAARKAVTAWIQQALEADGAARQERDGRVVLRRLNRFEYQNTIRDLLAIDANVKELLPPDDSADGFDNSAEALSFSAVLMARYLEAADAILNAAVRPGPRPETTKRRYPTVTSPPSRQYVYQSKNSNTRFIKDAYVIFAPREAFNPAEELESKTWLPPRETRISLSGRYRFTISCYSVNAKGPLTLGVYTQDTRRQQSFQMVRYFDVNPGTPETPQRLQFTHVMAPGEVLTVGPEALGEELLAEFLKYKRNNNPKEEYKGPGVAVQWLEVEGPLFDSWPPESQRRLFGDLPVVATAGKVKGGAGAKPAVGYVVNSTKPDADAEQLVRQFASRAFRRPPTEETLAPILDLVRAHLKEGRAFHEALLLGYQAALCSPDFLYLREKPGKLDDYALASRLSYFLWSSMPDQELLGLAATGRLSQPAVLWQQTERLLRDPKAAAFTENFVGQWLGLRHLESTAPDQTLYPEFDDLLRYSMAQETLRYFNGILHDDRSVLEFIDSDYCLLNGRLARHYGIPGVDGIELRKVQLPPGSDRGGVLGQASILRLTANGTTTSPVVRGAWVLRNLIGRPPAPPPPDVSAVEPDLKGAATIRELLDKHRVRGCAECHLKIDPLGFALEEFDPIGGRRDFYRSLGKGPRIPVKVRGRPVRYGRGPRVDASGELAGGRKYKDFTEYKRLLLEDKDQIARCLSEKLLTYATGRGIRPDDIAAVEAIVARLREKNYRLRSLIHEVVQSSVFLHK